MEYLLYLDIVIDGPCAVSSDKNANCPKVDSFGMSPTVYNESVCLYCLLMKPLKEGMICTRKYIP